MAIEALHIEQVTQEATWRLRQRALYPEADFRDMTLPNDDDATHFGAFLPKKLAGVVSLFPDGESAQVRKFAVDPDEQRQGIGSSLLEYVIDHARQHGIKTLWLNARVEAIAFYQKRGFSISGERFVKNGIDYVRMEQAL